jgi:hypothetical protein
VEQLKEAIIQSFNQQVQTGAVAAIVEAQVQKFAKSVIEDSLRSYSEFGRALEKKLEAGLLSSLDRFSLEQYNELIMKAIQDRIDEVYVKDAKTHLERILNETFRKPKAKYKLSEIVKEIRGGVEDHESISLYVDKHDRITFVYIDSEAEKKQYSCEWHLVIHNDDKVLASARRKQPYSGEKARPIKPDGSHMSRLESLLFQLVVHGTEIELDDDDAECVARGSSEY